MLEIGQWIGIGPLVGWLGRAIYISNQKQNSAFPFHPEAALSQLFPAAQSRHRTSALFCGQNTSKAMQDLMKPYVGRHLIWISHRYHLGDRSAYLFSPSSWTLFKTLNEKFPEVPRHLYTPDKLYEKHNHGKMWNKRRLLGCNCK